MMVNEGAMRILRGLSAAMLLCGGLSACASVSGGGLGDSASADPKPNIDEDPIARMSAESRYDTAVGCASATRLAMKASAPEVLTGFGMTPADAAAGAAQFGSYAERSAEIGERAARDAVVAGADLGKDEATVKQVMEADYTRLEGAFAGVAEAQPKLALFTIDDRLKRCSKVYLPNS